MLNFANQVLRVADGDAVLPKKLQEGVSGDAFPGAFTPRQTTATCPSSTK